jgi:hypothetical protein
VAVKPPPDVSPDRLWRGLLGTFRLDGTLDPRPSRVLAYRLPMADKVPLTVRAVPSLMLAEAWDAAACPEAPKVEQRRALRSVVAAVLWAQGEPFPGGLLGDLPGPVFEALAETTVDTLNAICPTFSRIDGDAWQRALKEGAAHPSNRRRAANLALCADPLVGQKLFWIPRPERYWGIPVGDLLDGHILAQEAAVAARKG